MGKGEEGEPIVQHGLVTIPQLGSLIKDPGSIASDDVYRVLPRCGHCFHVECIDRWALLSAGRGKRPTCPLCNAQL